MQEWTESELNWYLARLASYNIQNVASALSTVAQIGREPQPQPVPTGNAQVITYLEQLIEDHRICIVDWRIPYTFGELRWLAARALACEYAYQGIEEPIILNDVIQPIWSSEYAKSDRYRTIENLYRQGLVPNRTIEELIQQGLVLTKTEIIKPQDYAACCSKEAVEERKRKQGKVRKHNSVEALVRGNMSDTRMAIEAYWEQYLSTLPESERNQHYFEAVAWGNSDELADRIASLIVSGEKTTTSSLLWSQKKHRWALEQPGDKSIVLNSQKTPVCIIETVEVSIKPFNEVDTDFVYNYGEGDRTLNFWHQNMWEYYQQECAALGKTAEKDMPMICQVFKMIYKG